VEFHPFAPGTLSGRQDEGKHDDIEVARNAGRETRRLGKIEIGTVPIPTVGAGEILLATRRRLCGTDVKAFRRGHPYFQPPCVLGHELVGVVRDVGSGVRTSPSGIASCALRTSSAAGARRASRVWASCAAQGVRVGALQEYVLVPPMW